VNRLTITAALIGLAAFGAACSGGSNTDNPDQTGAPLTLVFAAASPSSGASPLRTTLTANITGGEAPYFYAWDFTNDGSFDDYRNNVFLKTLSVQHDYFLLNGGAAGDTTYQAVLRVTDSKNVVVTSDPVQIVVTADGGLKIDDVIVSSDEQAPTGGYVLSSGNSVYFHPVVTGGATPYSFQWDFNDDGAVDSTIQNPEYTFTYSGTGAKVFNVGLKVIDNKGQAVTRDTLVPIEGSGNTGGGGGGTNTDFTIVLNSNPPADSNGNIILNWDTSAGNPNLPLEPKLDLSVVVDASQGGRPPFEYYWDFEDDGAFDSQAVSPTVPYYDEQRKILVNPYLHQEKSKIYTLRVFVIDSLGKMQQLTRQIVSNNQENSGGKLTASATYGAANGTTFTTTPPQPYAKVENELDGVTFKFQVNAGGSTGTYDWQIDVDGDGTADWPSLADDPTGFHKFGSGTTDSITIPFGFYDDGGTQVADWAVPGYYAANATVRSLNPSNDQPVETFKLQMPVSLVRVDVVEISGGPALITRNDMVMYGKAADAIAGANGNYVPARTVVIAGGMKGTTPLNDVQEIAQVFDEPAAANKLETVLTTTTSGRFPLNQPRGGSVGVTNGTDGFIIGGQNIDNGILGTCEMQGLAANAPWAIAGEIRPGGYYPLTKMAGAFLPTAVNGIGPGFFFAGGLHPAGGGDVDNVSGRLIFTDLSDSDPNVNGTQLGFQGVGGGMVNERYDSCMAYVNNKLYVIGGRVANGRSVSTVEAFNLITGQWENVASLKDFRSGANCEVINNVIYVHGGAFYPGNEVPGNVNGNRTMVNTSECFNPLTGVWSYTVGLGDAENGVVTENGATCALAGAGSAASLPALTNQIWYLGGANAAAADTNNLYEFTYFYTITATP
jgi:PKD repeat protein